jgi:hypothetical protein
MTAILISNQTRNLLLTNLLLHLHEHVEISI